MSRLPGSLPWITIQPQSQTATVGQPATFTVSVTGSLPLSYQWQFAGTNIANATNSSLSIPSASTSDAGNYSVIVTNALGSALSSNALLTVIVPPTLALQLLAGYPLLNLDGMLSSNFVVQYSTNLAGTNWMNLLSLTNLPSSPYLFLDPAGDGRTSAVLSGVYAVIGRKDTSTPRFPIEYAFRKQHSARTPRTHFPLFQHQSVQRVPIPSTLSLPFRFLPLNRASASSPALFLSPLWPLR